MTNPRQIGETLVLDKNGGKRNVRAGDRVELILPPSEEKTDEDYFARRHYEFMKGFLEGNGPFEISWIGLWPCGRVMLYLKNPRGEPGAYASDFRCV